MQQLPLMPGTPVIVDDLVQTVQAVGWLGERYYWLVDSVGVVSMYPADVVESANATKASDQRR